MGRPSPDRKLVALVTRCPQDLHQSEQLLSWIAGCLQHVLRDGFGELLGPVFHDAGDFFSRKIPKLNPAEALGGVTGSMTSGAALSVVTAVAKSNVPALGYTGAYAFANVILTLAGTLIMLV